MAPVRHPHPRAYREEQRKAAAGVHPTAAESGQLDYSLAQLRYTVLLAALASRMFCQRVFALGGFAITYRHDPARYGPAANPYSYRNLLACCRRCALAKGTDSDTLMLELVATLKAEPDWIEAELRSLGRPGLAAAGRGWCGREGTSEAAAGASNAQRSRRLVEDEKKRLTQVDSG